ncbi:MAG: hypothetical protein K2X87_13360 [Gemmataceae bacterium]|nr:hypothetical protein [Gemmataceae bacterium]
MHDFDKLFLDAVGFAVVGFMFASMLVGPYVVARWVTSRLYRVVRYFFPAGPVRLAELRLAAAVTAAGKDEALAALVRLACRHTRRRASLTTADLARLIEAVESATPGLSGTALAATWVDTSGGTRRVQVRFPTDRLARPKDRPEPAGPLLRLEAAS